MEHERKMYEEAMADQLKFDQDDKIWGRSGHRAAEAKQPICGKFNAGKPDSSGWTAEKTFWVKTYS